MNQIKQMREKIDAFIKWILSNLAWDALKSFAGWILRIAISLIGSDVVVDKIPNLVTKANEFLATTNISLSGYGLIFTVVFFSIFGFISFSQTPVSLTWKYLIRSDKPKLIQASEWNAIVTHNDSKIAIGMISINNEPGRKTSRSTVYAVSARIEFFDRRNKHILTVKCGQWTQESAEVFFTNYGKRKGCEKIDFYTYHQWYLPIVYKVDSEEQVFAYDSSSPLRAKKIGKLPIEVRVSFEGENYKSAKSLNYTLLPQPVGLEGFWISKK